MNEPIEHLDLVYVNQGLRRYGGKPELPHVRNCWEIQAIVDGSCRLLLPEGRWSPAEGFLWLFRPDDVHGWGGESLEETCRIAVFHFNWIPPELEGLLGNRPRLRVPLEGEDAASGFRRLINEAYRAQERAQPRRQLMTAGILYALSARFFPGSERRGRAEISERKVRQAISWLRANLREGATVEGAARQVHVSPQHLRRWFRRHLREPPGRVVTRLRIERATELLEDPTFTLEAIAEAVGYSCAAALSRAYKTETGRSPRNRSLNPQKSGEAKNRI